MGILISIKAPERVFDLKEIANKLSRQPAAIIGLDNCGKIAQGYSADLVVADLDRKWKVEEENIVSKSKNTPFLGQELKGVIEYTLKAGKVIYTCRKN